MIPSNGPHLFTAGPLSVEFEDGAVRSVRAGGVEVLRGIYAAVRDRDWGTVLARVGVVDWVDSVDSGGASSFRVVVAADCIDGGIDYRWRGRIEGSSDGVLRFLFEGEARSDFLANRIGFCVLHPLSCAGLPCSVTHGDGGIEIGRFPERISPHQPFLDVAAIEHEPAPGLRVRVEMSGDTFEMEDQRNWTDASLKTYCRPLALPYPYPVRAGDRVRQTITVRVIGASASCHEQARGRARLYWGPGAPVPMPRIGLCADMHAVPWSLAQTATLRAVAPDHLRVDVRPSADDWRDRLQNAAAQVGLLGCELEIAIHVGTDPEREIARCASEVTGTGAPVARWLVYKTEAGSTSRPVLETARRALPSGSVIVGGTDANFAELNRGHTPPDACDALCFSVNPQVHAFDDRSLMESLEGQAACVESALALASGKPVVVSPVTLRPRGAAPDHRQSKDICAAWTLGSVRRLIDSGASSVTYFRCTGLAGIVDSDGVPYPAASVFQFLRGAGPRCDVRVLPLHSSDRNRIECLAIEGASGCAAAVANLTREPLEVALPSGALLSLGGFAVAALEEAELSAAARSPTGAGSDSLGAQPLRSAGFGPHNLESVHQLPGVRPVHRRELR